MNPRSLFIIVALVWGIGQASAGVPSTDLILYGRVFDGVNPIVGALPGPITVGIERAGTETLDPVLTTTSVLVPTRPGGPLEAYVLRIPRSEVGTGRTTPQSFVLPGDRLRIYIDGVEVAETSNDLLQLLVTDAVQDIRFLNLNGPTNPDSDADQLPDDWERNYLGGLAQGADDDVVGDKVSNLLALALGLNPNSNNSSLMPFLRIEQGGDLVYYYRQAVQETGFTYSIVSADSVGSAESRDPVAGVAPQEVTVEGASRIMKAVIPQGVDRPGRFFQLQINP